MGRSHPKPLEHRLFALSGNQCAAPDCNNKLTIDDKTNFGEICHIKGYSKNGPRFDPNISEEEKNSIDNLILLCRNCHKKIDSNPEFYTVELLTEWKKIHEDKVAAYISQKPTFLHTAIKAISKLDFEENEELIHDYSKPDIEKKIKYNNLEENKYKIQDYMKYQYKLNTLYIELEKQDGFIKINLLRNIRNLYLTVLGELNPDKNSQKEFIQNNSDLIFNSIRDKIFNLLKNISIENTFDYYFEVDVILVDAFIRCKILEKPV